MTDMLAALPAVRGKVVKVTGHLVKAYVVGAVNVQYT